MTCASLWLPCAAPGRQEASASTARAVVCFRYQAINALANQSGINTRFTFFSTGDANDGQQVGQLIKGHAEQFQMNLSSPSTGLPSACRK